MPDLLTALHQQIEALSEALCQIPGNLYLKAETLEGSTEVDLATGVPKIEPISQKLTTLIDALPEIDLATLPEKEREIVDLWEQRSALESQLREELHAVHSLQQRLTDVHEAIVIAEQSTKNQASLKNQSG